MGLGPDGVSEALTRGSMIAHLGVLLLGLFGS